MESSIGQRLREAREVSKHTIETVSFKTGLATRFILAAEENNFREFGARLYWEKYAKTYAEFLGIYDESFRDDLARVWETYAFRDALRFRKSAWWRRLVPNLRPRHNVFVLSVLAGLGIFFYFGYQLSFLISAPKLIIATPMDKLFATWEPSIVMRGQLKEEARLSINQRPIALAEDGKFQERLYLAKGLNRIDLEAVNVSGKLTRETRYILLIN